MTLEDARNHVPSPAIAGSLADEPGSALNDWLEELYGELRSRASACLRGERPDHTLQTTALVHEAYLRLRARSDLRITGRGPFLALAAEVIRSVLVDHARRRAAAKRGGRVQRLLLADDVQLVAREPRGSGAVDLLELDRALGKLARLHARQGRIVELRFFAGLSIAEVAGILGVSPGTVKGDWRMARAWLRAELTGRRAVE